MEAFDAVFRKIFAKKLSYKTKQRQKKTFNVEGEKN